MKLTGCRRESADRSRRQYGWLRMVFPGARLFHAPIWCSSGRGDTREVGSAVAESLLALNQVGTYQIRRERRAVRSSTSQESAEPLCARIKGANREVSEEKLISDPDMFSSYEGRQGAANGQDSWRGLHQPKASTTMDPGISIFPICVMMCGIKKLGLIGQN